MATAEKQDSQEVAQYNPRFTPVYPPGAPQYNPWYTRGYKPGKTPRFPPYTLHSGSPDPPETHILLTRDHSYSWLATIYTPAGHKPTISSYGSKLISLTQVQLKRKPQNLKIYKALVTRVRASPELRGFWIVLVMHSLTWEMETRLGKVSRPMSSVFSW